MLQRGSLLSHYRVETCLGTGGMGAVYRAIDERLGRPVALKILAEPVADDEPERLARLRTEARAVAALNHPNIVTLFDFDVGGDTPFLVLELVDGRPLTELIPPGGMSLHSFVGLAEPLARAVAFAHSRGVLHRDLKPSNVMVDGSGTVKVLDFGLAKLAQPVSDDAGATATFTSPGMLLGTLPYMSPEALRGEPADSRSDVFSLGVVFYEMTTGRRPFRGRTPAEQISANLREDPVPLKELRPDLPAWLHRTLDRMLAKDPAERPASEEVVSALERVKSEEDQPLLREASLAILPFADLSPGADQGYFCQGLAEELIHALARIRRLKVASRTASLRFAETDLDLTDIGRQLGVQAVLEGSVRKWQDQLRIGARLVDVATGDTLWDERFDRGLEDIFTVQEDIAAQVVRSLLVTLAPGEDPAPRDRGHENPRAYELYLQGRHHFYLDTREGFESARKHFRRAMDIEPSYGRAQAGLADCASFLYKHFGHHKPELETALDASRRAVEIAPDLAEARASRGLALHLAGRDEEGEEELQLAMRLDPYLFEPYYFSGQVYLGAGRLADAVWCFERAEAARPDDYQSPIMLASHLRALGRVAEAEAAFERGLEKVRSRLDLHPKDVRAWYFGGGALAALGRTEEAREWVAKVRELEPGSQPLVRYNLAVIFATIGDVEEGLKEIEAALEAGFRHFGALENDPDLEPLRRNPRYGELLDRFR